VIRGPYRLQVRARRRARTAAALQAAALREVSRRGYQRLRIADVARRARVAVRTVYLHAPAKEALVEDALRARAEALERRVERWRPRGAMPEGILDELVALHGRSYRGDKPLLDTLLDGGVPNGAPILRRLDNVRLAIIARTMAELGRRGALRVRPTDATAIAHALLAYPTWRIALTGPAGRRAQRLVTSALRASVLG